MADLVIDANVAVLPAQRAEKDPRADVARRVLPAATEAYGLAAPALLAWEIGQIVHRKRAAEWPDLATRQGTAALLVQDVDLDVPDAAAAERCGSLAEKHAISYYDAAYLELALRKPSGLLVTEDERLRRAAALELGPDRALDLHALGRLVE